MRCSSSPALTSSMRASLLSRTECSPFPRTLRTFAAEKTPKWPGTNLPKKLTGSSCLDFADFDRLGKLPYAFRALGSSRGR